MAIETYLTFTGQNPADTPTETTYRVQIRAPRGKYRTVLETWQVQRACLVYDGYNVGNGHAKRLLADGRVVRRQITSAS